MEGKTRQNRVRRSGDQSGVDDTSGKQRLEHLRLSFEAFRREHGRGTRIPRALRGQVLAALANGAPEIEVRRACGISALQLSWWRRDRPSRAPGLQLQAPARVFPVVDDSSSVPIERFSDDHQAQNLELRIGGWAISIRQIER